MLEKIEGIILKTLDYGETHKIITIFSKRIGKFSAIARGAKKPKSRMAAITQPFIYGQFLTYLHKGLSTIQQGEIIESFRPIREDIVKTAYTAYIIEYTDKLVDEKDADPYIFNQLYETMMWIAEYDDYDIPVMMYEWKLMKKGGFAPTIDRCVRCNATKLPFHFSINEGGFLCTRCSSIDNQAIPLSDTLAKLLYMFITVDLKRVRNISVKEENKKKLRKITDAYYEHYGGFYLKSKRFLEQMNRLM